MRLTLRTLLAYLDDLLEPSQTKEIGAKVNESGYASMLINRIREVMRRRRLTAPDVSGPEMGLDPNNVAKYLDNTLGPEAVADVEKVCLDSDVHLAEVAACHQVLTLVLGEPVDVPASTRERMYALGPKTPSGSNGHKEERSDPEVRTVTGSSNKSDSPAPSPARTNGDFDGVPEYLKPVPVWKRLGPVAVGLLVGSVWLWLVYFDPSLNKPDGQEIASTGNSTQSTPAGNGPGDAIAPEGNTEPPIENESTKPGSEIKPEAINSNTIASTNTNDVQPFDQLPNFDPAAPPDLPTTTTPETTVIPPVSTPEIASEEKPTPAKPTAVTPAVADPPSLPDVAVRPAPEVIYLSREGLLARKVKDGWMAMPGRTAIRSGDLIASPEPFEAVLQIAALHLTIEMKPGSLVRYLGAVEKSDVAFEIRKGRIAINRSAPDGTSAPVTAGVRLFGEDCFIKLASSTAICGVEVTPREPRKFEDDLSADPYSGSLFVVKGQAAFESQVTAKETLMGPAWMPLGVKDRKALATASRPPLLTTPGWLDSDQSGVSRTVRTYSSRLQKALDPDLPLEHTVPAVVLSSVPRLAEYATKALVVTEQIPGLVEAMGRGEHEEVRTAAITGLRQWLPQSEGNKEKLRTELEKHFTPDEVDPLYRLLWGYDDSDARNQVTSRMLVDWLKHGNVVIRQLAFMHIYRLTGQKYDYRPINPPNQRKVAINRWEQHLKKNDDQLIK